MTKEKFMKFWNANKSNFGGVGKKVNPETLWNAFQKSEYIKSYDFYYTRETATGKWKPVSIHTSYYNLTQFLENQYFNTIRKTRTTYVETEYGILPDEQTIMDTFKTIKCERVFQW